MTHQLQVVGINKFLRYAINQKLHAFLSKYNMIWVPDEKGHKLSGLLSKNLKLKNIDYIGPLSHLKQKSEELVYDYAIVLSGPEPARTVFQSSLISALSKKAHLKIALVQGTADTGIKTTPDHWDVHQLLDSEKLSKLIAQSRKIICRSGYSSIMDLYTLNKPAIMIPTPGQPEQIYLAQHLDNKYGFITIKQSNIKNGLDQLTT